MSAGMLLAFVLGSFGCQTPLTKAPTRQQGLEEVLVESLQRAENASVATESRVRHGRLSQPVSTSKPPAPYPPPAVDPPFPAGSLVNEIFEETDVREAIQSLASQAKVGVIIDDQVAGVVTALIEDVPFTKALEQILLPLGYIWTKKDDQFLIGTPDPSSALFRYLSIKLEYQSRHFPPEDLVPLLPETMAQYVRIVGRRNLIVVHAPDEIAHQIIDELQNADRPVPQVVLEAIVTVHSPDSSYQFGIDLRQILEQSQDADLSAGINSLAVTGRLTPASIGDLFGDFGATSYFIRCLEQQGYLEITASPRVMAKSGEKAQISIARETFFATQPLNRDVFFRQDIQKVDAGIILDITPVIRGDMVTVMIERAEVSEDIRETGSDPDLARPYPLINRRLVTTTVDVKDGETITIGGLTHRQMIDRENRVPVLGSLPIVGKLFRQIDKQNEEAEVTVFISPRIVRGTEPTLVSLPPAASQ